jgi:hypothetical protein
MRARMEQHRSNPVCASCHARMDPIGLALERTDAIGRLRDTEGGQRIDTSGVLPDGTKIEGVVDLRRALVARPDTLVHTVAEKLLTYALGRGLGHHDAPAIRAAVHAAAPDYRWSPLILHIVKSVPFQMRRVE